MKTKFYLSLFLAVAITSCKKESISSTDGLTISDFKTNLKPAMNYDSIVAQFGDPSKDIGSGIHIYVYILTDGTEIWIGYVTNIQYARHMDKNGQLIEILI